MTFPSAAWVMAKPLVSKASFIVLDTFTDSDATNLEDHTPEVGGPWTENSAGDMQISGNKLVPVSGATNLFCSIPTNTDNYTVIMTVTAGSDNGFNEWGITFSFDIGTNRGYRFLLNVTDNTWYLYRKDASQFLLDSGAFTITPGNSYELKVVRNGSDIECFIDGSSVTTQSEGTYTTQAVGIFSYDDALPNGALAFDDFQVS